MKRIFTAVMILAGIFSGLFVTVLALIAISVEYTTVTNTRAMEQKARNGDADSQRILASGYDWGNQRSNSWGRISRDENKAIYWYTRSADGGNSDASCFLAELYERKHQTDALAFSWFVRSAKSGNSRAAQRLSVVYKQGLLGQKRSLAESEHWANKSRKGTIIN